jgi:hypothetical protein
MARAERDEYVKQRIYIGIDYPLDKMNKSRFCEYVSLCRFHVSITLGAVASF